MDLKSIYQEKQKIINASNDRKAKGDYYGKYFLKIRSSFHMKGALCYKADAKSVMGQAISLVKSNKWKCTDLIFSNSNIKEDVSYEKGYKYNVKDKIMIYGYGEAGCAKVKLDDDVYSLLSGEHTKGYLFPVVKSVKRGTFDINTDYSGSEYRNGKGKIKMNSIRNFAEQDWKKSCNMIGDVLYGSQKYVKFLMPIRDGEGAVIVIFDDGWYSEYFYNFVTDEILSSFDAESYNVPYYAEEIASYILAINNK